MSWLHIRKWEHWQSYRSDRDQPPWIKLHRRVMRDPDWVGLTDAQRGQLVAIWLLAADNSGWIPAEPRVVQKLCYMDTTPDFDMLIKQGFIEPDACLTPERRQGDAGTTPERRQGDALDKTREDKTRQEKKKSKSRACKHALPDDFALTDDMLAYAEGKGLAMRAAEREFEKFVNHADSSNRKCANWHSAWRNWVLKAVEFSPPPKSAGSIGSVSA